MSADAAVSRDRWTFENVYRDGAEYTLSGGHGAVEHHPIGDGLVLYRGELVAERTCIIEPDWDVTIPQMSLTMLLVGEAVLETPEGGNHRLSGRRALLKRINRAGCRFIIPAGQTVRQIGIAADIPTLARPNAAATAEGSLDEGLAAFERPPATGIVIQPVQTSSRMRRLATQLFAASTATAAGRLTLSGLGMLLLSDVLAAADARNESWQAKSVTAWERRAITTVERIVREEIDRPIAIDALAHCVQMPRHRLLGLFRQRHGVSLADYIRGHRLSTARRALEAGTPIKQVAVQVGYAHVTNFATAYRSYFGETPATTVRRHRD